jgi:hypothetical protein
MMRITAIGFALALSSALLLQGFPAAEAAEKANAQKASKTVSGKGLKGTSGKVRATCVSGNGKVSCACGNRGCSATASSCSCLSQ